MNDCPEYKEILLLDIYGELDSESRSKWQSHLKKCGVCQEERSRMMRLMGKMKGVMSPPPIALRDTEGLVKAVRAEVRQSKQPGIRWPWEWLSRPWRIGPALATACVFAAIISIWSLGTFDSFFGRDPISGKDFLQEMRPEEAEIIRNLDFLEHMDSVEKLVQTLDEPEEDPPAPEGTSNTQGMIDHEKRVHYS
jgi:hypothetical protein